MKPKLKELFSKKVSVLIILAILAVAVFLTFTSQKSIDLGPIQSPSPTSFPSPSPEVSDTVTKTNEPKGSPSPVTGCRITGCSGQICSDEDVVTTCEFKEEYACYKTAKCEKQEDGKCGWIPSEELVACLMSVFQAESESQ
ncbi:MAG: hypothetical protein Q8Q89_04630 [bacterium]|nr:hypothetical protein [bacterium]